MVGNKIVTLHLSPITALNSWFAPFHPSCYTQTKLIFNNTGACCMFLQVNHIRLYYEVCGTGRPLILLHGNGQDHTIFDKLAPALADHFTVYLLDSRGHGQSSPVSVYHYAEMAQDVACFIQRLHLKQPIIYGFSDGGILALLLAIHYPLLAGGIVISGANTCPAGLRAGRHLKFWWRWLTSREPRIWLMLQEPHITAQQLSSIQLPCLVLAGSNDLVSERNTSFIAAHIKNARLCIYPGHTHTSYVVHQDFLAPVIRRFAECCPFM